MTINLKHPFVSAKPDGTDASKIQPSNWNALHQLTAAAKRLLGRYADTDGDVQEISVGSGLDLSDAGVLSASLVPVVDPVTGEVSISVGSAYVPASLQTPTFCSIGNSLTANAGPAITSSLSPMVDSGWVGWALGFLGPKLIWTHNAGVSGNTFALMTARVTEVPMSTGFVSLMEGRNSMAPIADGGGGRTVAQTIADFELCLTALKTRNPGRVVLMTHPTASSKPASYGGTQLQWNSQIMAFNQYLRSRVPSIQGAILVDAEAVMIDPVSATAAPKANYLGSDGTHPSAKGARQIGKAFADALAGYLSFGNLYVPTNNNFNLTTAPTSGSKILNSNPLFTGSGGTATGSTGTVAATCAAGIATGTATCADTVVARSDSYGNDQTLVISGASSGASAFVRSSNNEAISYFAQGDYLYAQAQISITGMTDVIGIELALYLQSGGVYTGYGLQKTATVNTSFDQTDLINFCICTNRIQFNQASSTLLYPRLNVYFGTSGAGAATIKVGRMVCVNLGQTSDF